MSSTTTTWTTDGLTKATNSTSTNDSLSISGNLTVGGTLIGDVAIGGDLTVTGGDIDLSGEASQITLIDDTVGALQIGSTGNLDVIKISTTDNAAYLQINGDRTDAGIAKPSLDVEATGIMTGNHDDSYVGAIAIDTLFAGNYTITRHNYILLEQPNLTGSAAITDACVFTFDAAKGTHKAVDSGSAHPDIDTADAWMKININGTVHYIPCYTDKS